MPLNSVQKMCKSLIDGLVFPDYQEPLVVYIAPPSPGDLLGPTCYIWGSTWHVKRQTAPRPVAFMAFQWLVDMWLLVPDSADYPNADSAFPIIIDTITRVLRTTKIPIMLEDPDTGEETQIVAIGETMDGDYAPVHALGDENTQGWVLYQAHITCTVEERVQL